MKSLLALLVVKPIYDKNHVAIYRGDAFKVPANGNNGTYKLLLLEENAVQFSYRDGKLTSYIYARDMAQEAASKYWVKL